MKSKKLTPKIKTNVVYYLKKKHPIFITEKNENEKIMIDRIDNFDILYGHFVDDANVTFFIAKEDFSKIFQFKPS